MSEQIKTYPVRKLTAPVSGELTAVPWEEASLLSDFSYPWEENDPPTLEFRGLYDKEWLYVYFNVVDKDFSTYVSSGLKQEVLYGDRVEIFLAPDRSLTTYYGVETDIHARVYDYKASFYRNFDDTWSWPAHDIIVRSATSDTGYQVFMALRLSSLETLGLLKNNEILAGLFRGKCADASPSNDSMRWISWLKPESRTPDFHRPDSFGRFLLQ